METITIDGKKFIQCSPGDQLEIGCVVKIEGYGVRYYKIYRVSKTTAFISYGAADGKFPRIVSGYFRPKGKTGMSTVIYYAFKPVDV